MNLVSLEKSLKLHSNKFIPSQPIICQGVPYIAPKSPFHSFLLRSYISEVLSSVLWTVLQRKIFFKKRFIDAFYPPSAPFSYELLFLSFYVTVIQPCS